jgi:hypothetical protein
MNIIYFQDFEYANPISYGDLIKEGGNSFGRSKQGNASVYKF